MVAVSGFSLTPFVAADYVDVDLDGYTEAGASVSNVVYADRSFKKLSASVGGELEMQLGAIRPAMHESAISGYVVGRGRSGRGDDARASIGIGYASEARFRSPFALARR